MKIVIVCIHYPVASGRYAAAAFRHLGHDVRTLGQSTGKAIWGTTVDSRYIWEPDGNITQAWTDWTPDLIILMDSAWRYHHPVYQSVPHIVWGVDNHVRDYDQPGITHYFLAHKAASMMQWDKSRFTWLPCAGASEFMPSPMPWADRPYDVAMIGVPYPARRALAAKIEKAGLKLLAGYGFLYDQYQQVHHLSRVAVNLSAAHDLNQRIFEAARFGCAVVSDALPDLDALDPKAPVWQVKDDKDWLPTIEKALGKPESAGVFPVWAEPHTWEARAQVIVDWFNATYGKKAKSGK